MFSSLGWPEIAVLFVTAMFVFGPERLPGLAADAGRALRKVRDYGRSMRDDLAEDVPELRSVDVRSLNPRTFLVKHVLADEAPVRPRTPRPPPPSHAVPAPAQRSPSTAPRERSTTGTRPDRGSGGIDGALGDD